MSTLCRPGSSDFVIHMPARQVWTLARCNPLAFGRAPGISNLATRTQPSFLALALLVYFGYCWSGLYTSIHRYTRFALRWDVPMSPCVMFFVYLWTSFHTFSNCPAQSFRTWSFVLGYGLWISSRSNRAKAFSSQYLHPIVQTSAKVRGSFVGRCWHFHARCCSHLMVHDESIMFSDFYQVCCFHVERSVLVTQCIEWHLPQAQTKRSQLAIAW